MTTLLSNKPYFQLFIKNKMLVSVTMRDRAG
jgi:hypothetical protein